MSWIAIGTTAASIGSGFLKKKTGGETIRPEQIMPEWQKALGGDLSSWISGNLSRYNPAQDYTGQLSADMTGFERLGLGKLGDFLSQSPTGDLFGAGKTQIMDTLGGKFADPNESPWIKSMINLSKINLQDQVDASRRSAGSRGNYFTRSAINEESDLRNRTLANLDAVVGNFMNQERGRQFEAAPIAQQMDQYGNITAPLAQVGASQTYGSLERTLEQADLERQYQDFMRKQTALGQVPNQGLNLYNSSPQMGIGSLQMPQTEQSTTMGNILGILGKLNWNGLSNGGGIAGLFS